MTARLPFDILHSIILFSARSDLPAWSLVSWECFTVAGRALRTTLEVPAQEKLYVDFFGRLVSFTFRLRVC